MTDPDPGGPFRSTTGSAAAVVRHTSRQWLTSLGLLAALTLMMFADVLFTAAPVVLSNRNTDISLEYLHWRSFGFSELKHGNLALWNPCLFSGAPFFGGAQAALLYPPNALFLFLPLHQAINWSIALHIFLAGAFTYAWVARRGFRPPSCFLSAVTYMFCGANFLHVYSGYLSFLCGLVWAPLLFLAIDGLFEAPTLGWSLLGMAAVAMQLLAGNPQSLFYTAVAAAIYGTLCDLRVRARRPFLLGLAGIVLGGVALGAVQFLAGVQEWGEMLRSSGVPFQFASMFSFPPENFLTLLAPHLFGDVKTVSYWGRSYLWEMSLFIGLTGFVLAIVGAAWGDKRMRRFSLIMILLLLLLALGAHTPLFRVLYAWVPGFNKFRGNSKFIFLASLFLSLLAGLGFDELIRRRQLPRLFLGALAAISLLLVGIGVVTIPSSPTASVAGFWHHVLVAVGNAGESYVPANTYDNAAFVLGAARLASRSLVIAGATMALVSLLLWCLRRWRSALGWLLALAVIELFIFARLSLDHFDLQQAVEPEIKRFLDEHPGDYRIANLDSPNTALSLRAQDVWGYEPGVVLRYAQLLASAQGLDPDQAVLLTIRHNAFWPTHPLLGMLRCRFVFAAEGGALAVHERTNYLPHVLLVQRCRVMTDRAQIFSAVTNAAFDPRQEVILEVPPDPAPVVSAEAGSVKLTDSSTDHLGIEADLPSAAILLVPDVYAKGWRAVGMPGSAQSRYKIQPANWCLRAIPLSAGHHRLRLEYAPLGFRLGRWISLIFLPIFLGLVVLSARRCVWARGLDQLPDDRWQITEEARSNAALAAGLVAAALLVFWPMVGRGFLSYGSTYVPVAGLLVVVVWSGWQLAARWHYQFGRLLAIALSILILGMAVVYREIAHWSNSKPAVTASKEGARDTVGEALLKQGRFDEAIAHFEQALQANPDLPDAQQNLAVAFLRKGRSEDAIAHFKVAVRLNPKLASAQNTLAALLLKQGQLDEAVTHFQAAIKAQPSNPNYLNNLAWMLATCPQPAIRDGHRAVELATQAESFSGGKNPSVLGTLAAAYAEAGLLEQATATAQRALELASSQTNRAVLASIRLQLEHYRAGSPFRDTSQTNAGTNK